MSNTREISEKLDSKSWIPKKSQQVIDETPLVFTKLYKEHENPDKWLGKVSGSRQEILKALIFLGRKPRNPEELDRVIIKQMQEGLGKILEEADKQHQYTPY